MELNKLSVIIQRRIEIRRYNIGHPYGIFNVNNLFKKMWVMDRVATSTTLIKYRRHFANSAPALADALDARHLHIGG